MTVVSAEGTNQCSYAADGIVDILRSIFGTTGACISIIQNGCLLLRQSSGGVKEGSVFDAPGFCFWTLVPEQPQALVIEDTRLDARSVQCACDRCYAMPVCPHPNQGVLYLKFAAVPATRRQVCDPTNIHEDSLSAQDKLKPTGC